MSVSPTRGGAPQGQGPSSFFSCAQLLTQHVGTTGAHYAQSFSLVQLFATSWTVAHQAPLSMGFSRQEYWNGLPCLPPGDLPNPGIKARSPKLQADFFTRKPWCPLKLPKWIDGTLTFLKGLQYAPLSLNSMLLLTNFSFMIALWEVLSSPHFTYEKTEAPEGKDTHPSFPSQGAAESARNLGSIPGSGRSIRGGHGNPFIHVFLCGEPHGQRRPIVHGVANSKTCLKWLNTCACAAGNGQLWLVTSIRGCVLALFMHVWVLRSTQRKSLGFGVRNLLSWGESFLLLNPWLLHL